MLGRSSRCRRSAERRLRSQPICQRSVDVQPSRRSQHLREPRILKGRPRVFFIVTLPFTLQTRLFSIRELWLSTPDRWSPSRFLKVTVGSQMEHEGVTHGTDRQLNTTRAKTTSQAEMATNWPASGHFLTNLPSHAQHGRTNDHLANIGNKY